MTYDEKAEREQRERSAEARRATRVLLAQVLPEDQHCVRVWGVAGQITVEWEMAVNGTSCCSYPVTTISDVEAMLDSMERKHRNGIEQINQARERCRALRQANEAGGR